LTACRSFPSSIPAMEDFENVPVIYFTVKANQPNANSWKSRAAVAAIRAVKVTKNQNGGENLSFFGEDVVLPGGLGLRRSKRPCLTFAQERGKLIAPKPGAVGSRNTLTEETLLRHWQVFVSDNDQEPVLLISRRKGHNEADLMLLRLSIYSLRLSLAAVICDAPTLAEKLTGKPPQKYSSWKKKDPNDSSVDGFLSNYGYDGGPEQAKDLIAEALLEGENYHGESVVEAAHRLKVILPAGQLMEDALKGYKAWQKRRKWGTKRRNDEDAEARRGSK